MKELKAKPVGWGSEGSGRHKKGRRTAAQAFNGVVELTTTEYARFEECMTNPGEPTEAAKRGAALIRKLYG